MYDVFTAEGGVAMHEVAHEGECFCFWESLIFFTFFEVVFKISIFAVLEYHVDMLSWAKVIVEFDDEGRGEGGEIFDLIFDLFFNGFGDFFYFYTFDCDLGAFFVLAVEDRTSCSYS